MSDTPEPQVERDNALREMFQSAGWKCLVKIFKAEMREIELACARRKFANGVSLIDEELKDLSVAYFEKESMINLPKTLLSGEKEVDEKEEKSYNVYDSVGDDTEGIATLDPIDET